MSASIVAAIASRLLSETASEQTKGAQVRLSGGSIASFRPALPLRIAILPLLLGAMVALLAHFEMLRDPNAALFDVAVSDVEPGPPRALVVRARPAEVPLVVERLRELGANRIAVTSGLAERGVRPPGVLIGWNPAQVPGTDFWWIPSADAIVADFVPLNQGQVGRRALLRLPGEFGPLSTMEGAIAPGAYRSSEIYLALSSKTIMPILESEDLLEKDLPLASIKGFDVVIGPPVLQDPPRIRTSALPGSVATGAAGFHARAFHALRSGSVAVPVDGLARALLLVGWSALLALLLVWVPQRHQAATAVLAAALAFGLGMAMVTLAGVLLPIAGLVLVALGTGLGARLLDRAERRRAVAHLGERIAGNLRQQRVLRDASRWTEFFSAAARLTGVESSLLARQQADGSFVPVAAFGPASSHGAAGLQHSTDLARADAHRPAPIEVNDLSAWQGGSLARLNSVDFKGLYWLYTIPPNSTEREEIAAAAARLAQTARASHGGPPRSARMLQDAEKAHSRLERAVGDLLRRNDELERSLAAVQDAVALFDASGIPFVMNPSMRAMIEKSGLQPGRTTPVDLAIALSGMEADAARAAIGQIVRRGGEVHLPQGREIAGRCYAVRVARVAGELLIEATDATEQKRLARLQADLAENIDARLRNDVEAMNLAVRLAQDDRLPVEKRERALGLLTDALGRVGSAIEALSDLADTTAAERDAQALAVNPRVALGRAVERLGPGADAAGVEIRVTEPALASLVDAEPDALDQLVEAMLQIVIGDSGRGSAVDVKMVEHERSTTLDISGGFGLPAALFAASLARAPEDSASPFAIVSRAFALVSRWGGALTATSDAGEGYRFTLELRRA